MNLKQLEVFIHVAELGSFSRAAALLDIAQPALSRHVRTLEVELHANLLVRNGRGVTLTDAGQRLLTHARDILARVAQAQDDLGAQRHEPVGHIVVGLPPSLTRRLTLPLIEHFKHHLPKARVAIMEGFSAHIVEWLSESRVDLGLIYNPDPDPHIDIEPVLEERLCLISAARHAPKGPISLAALSDYPLVMPQRGHTFRRLMEAQAAWAGVHLDIAWEVSSVPAILDLVRHGHGHAALTDSAIRLDASSHDLAVTAIREPVISSSLCLATAAHRHRTPLINHTAQTLMRLCRAD